jgi:hypothetical protein
MSCPAQEDATSLLFAAPREVTPAPEQHRIERPSQAIATGPVRRTPRPCFDLGASRARARYSWFATASAGGGTTSSHRPQLAESIRQSAVVKANIPPSPLQAVCPQTSAQSEGNGQASAAAVPNRLAGPKHGFCRKLRQILRLNWAAGPMHENCDDLRPTAITATTSGVKFDRRLRRQDRNR